MFAAAASGLTMVSIDPAVSDAAAVREILAQNKCKTLVYSGREDAVELLEKAVPNFAEYKSRVARPFYDPVAPDLKFFVSIGLDMQPASYNYQHMLAYHDQEPLTYAVPDTALLAVAYDAKGARTEYTHAAAIDGAFPALNAVLKKQHAVF